MIERFSRASDLSIEHRAIDPNTKLVFAEYPSFLADQWRGNENLIESPPGGRRPVSSAIRPSQRKRTFMNAPRNALAKPTPGWVVEQRIGSLTFLVSPYDAAIAGCGEYTLKGLVERLQVEIPRTITGVLSNAMTPTAFRSSSAALDRRDSACFVLPPKLERQ